MHTLFHNSTTRRFLENLTKHEGRAESAHLSPLCCETRITDLCTWHLFQLNQKELNLVGFFNLNILRIVVNWSGHQKIHIKYSHVYEYLHLFLCWWWMPIVFLINAAISHAGYFIFPPHSHHNSHTYTVLYIYISPAVQCTAYTYSSIWLCYNITYCISHVYSLYLIAVQYCIDL